MGIIMNRTPTSMIATTFALIAILSCTDSPAGPGLGTDDLSADANRIVAAIQVHLAPDSIAVGQTIQATVTMQDRRGRPIDRAVQWSSSNSAVATVTDSGLVTGVAPGSATITATHRTVTGSADVTVTGTDSVTPPPPPPPPPPPGNLLFEEDFENSNIASR